MKPLLPLTVLVSCAPVWAQNALSVHVVDAARKPIAGAPVQVRLWFKNAPVIAPKATDASGVAGFSLPSAPGGKPSVNSVVVKAKGFALGEGGARGGQVEVRLERGALWRGKIVDEAGKPLAGARITLRGMRKPDELFSPSFLSSEDLASWYAAKSKADGTFEIADVPADKELLFFVTRAGFARVPGQNAHAGTDELIKMAPGGSLRGRALDVEGNPIAKLLIFAGSSAGSNEATTDANGVFTITQLAPGIYDLTPDLSESAAFILPRLHGVRVEAGKTAVAPVWRGQKGIVIRGIARDAATKKPIVGANFAAMNAKDRQRNDDSAYARSDATGHFVLRVAQAGKYDVRCNGAAFGWMRSTATQRVTVGATASPELVFELQRAPVVRGVTVDEHDKPFSAHLTIGERFGGPDTITDAQGKWQYTPQSAEALTFGGGSDDAGYFEVIAPQKVDFPPTGPIFVKMRHRPWQTLEGRAVTPDGTPVEGVKIECEFTVLMGDSMGYGASVSATSGKDGRFVLSRLRDSRRPNVSGTELKVSGKKAGFQFQSGGQVSREGDQPRVNDLIFVPLAGKVEGTTQPGAQVVVAGRETHADARGHFAFESLPLGQTPCSSPTTDWAEALLQPERRSTSR